MRSCGTTAEKREGECKCVPDWYISTREHRAHRSVDGLAQRDWYQHLGIPTRMERTGNVGPASMEWTAEYGSVIASAYDIATTDGMNEAGLATNVLWLTESDYPEWDGDTPGLAVSLWAQYLLDNFATVAEAVENHRKEDFVVVSDEIPDEGRFATLHLSISDATGDSAILEYVDGELTALLKFTIRPGFRGSDAKPASEQIEDGKRVSTPFDQQLEHSTSNSHSTSTGRRSAEPSCYRERIARLTDSPAQVSMWTQSRKPRIVEPQRRVSSVRSATFPCPTASVHRTNHISPRRVGARSPITEIDATTSNRRSHRTSSGWISMESTSPPMPEFDRCHSVRIRQMSSLAMSLLNSSRLNRSSFLAFPLHRVDPNCGHVGSHEPIVATARRFTHLIDRQLSVDQVCESFSGYYNGL